MSDYSQFEKRKQDHIALALLPSNQADECNILDSVTLTHEALPDLHFDELQIRSTRFGNQVSTPFIVGSMTAGHREAFDINRCLIAACAMSGWAMGVGSQRRQLTDELAGEEWLQLRREFPDVSLFSNIGIAQLINTPLASIKKLTQSLNADALIIHCNPLQECIQPEGTPQFKDCWQSIDNLVRLIELPVVIKETGCGFSAKTLTRLRDIGVAAVDVSGLGGTHWGRIEGHRADHDTLRRRTSKTFANWGIDTVSSVKAAVASKAKYEIWGSGGVRHGLDAARLLALGASTISFAKPMLMAALDSTEAVYEEMNIIEYELKVAMFCTGSSKISELKDKIC